MMGGWAGDSHGVVSVLRLGTVRDVQCDAALRCVRGLRAFRHVVTHDTIMMCYVMCYTLDTAMT